MTGTAVLIGEDHTVTVLEDVSHDVYEKLISQGEITNLRCTIADKEVIFDEVSEVVWQEDQIDWAYGY